MVFQSTRQMEARRETPLSPSRARPRRTEPAWPQLGGAPRRRHRTQHTDVSHRPVPSEHPPTDACFHRRNLSIFRVSLVLTRSLSHGNATCLKVIAISAPPFYVVGVDYYQSNQTKRGRREAYKTSRTKITLSTWTSKTAAGTFIVSLCSLSD